MVKMKNDNDKNQDQSKSSFLSKAGEVIKKGLKIAGKLLLLVPKSPFYISKKPFARIAEAKHDAKVAIKEAVGIEVPEKERKYNPPIELTQASEDLGVRIVSCEGGKVKFVASRTLTGDIPHLSSEQLNKIKKDFPNIAIDRERNQIIIEIDVEKIINSIKADPNNKGISEEQIEKLAIKEIEQEVDRNLKGIAKITGGRFKRHTDLKLLYGVAQKLYKEYYNKKEDHAKSSEAVKSLSNVQEPSETLIPKAVVSGGKEGAKKAIAEAQKLREQLGKSQGIGHEDLKHILQPERQLTGDCGLEADNKWREKQGQKTESQDSKKQKGFSVS